MIYNYINKPYIFQFCEGDFLKSDLYLNYMKKNQEMMSYLNQNNIKYRRYI